MQESKLYFTTAFTGHYPVGVSAIVRAKSPEHGAELINAKLKEQGLPGDLEPCFLTCLSDAKEDGAIILQNGDY